MYYNWHIIGHEKQLKSLEEDILNNNLAHAYLFSGPEQIGKTIVAKTMAHIIQCPNQYCRTCYVCVQISKNSHLDTIQMLNTKESIKIEQIREMISALNMTAQSTYKVVLIENVERMTNEAANCFLKTLEEPASKVVFLLTTSKVTEVLPTLISRTRILNFHSFTEEFLYEELKKHFLKIDEETVKKSVAFSSGKATKAVMLLENNELLKSYERIYTVIRKFLIEKPDISSRFYFIDELCKEKEQIEIFLDIFMLFIRKALLNEIDQSNAEEMYGYTPEQLIALVESIDFTRDLLKKNINSKLALENLILKI